MSENGKELDDISAGVVVKRLLAERRINWRDIHRAIGQEIREIDAKMKRIASYVAEQAGAAAEVKTTRVRRKRIDPKVKASRELQGKYLALIRNFSKRDRAKYSKIASEKSRAAAIRQMRADLKERETNKKAAPSKPVKQRAKAKASKPPVHKKTKRPTRSPVDTIANAPVSETVQ